MFNDNKEKNAIRSEITKKRLINFYGDKFESKKQSMNTPRKMKQNARIKISYIKSQIKSEQKNFKKIYKSTKKREHEIYKRANISSAMERSANVYKISDKVKNYKKYSQINSFLANEIKKWKNEIKEVKKSFKKVRAGIKHIDESIEKKNFYLEREYKDASESQESLAKKIIITHDFLKRKISFDEYKKTETGKEILKKHGVVSNYNDLLSERDKIKENSSKILKNQKESNKNSYKGKIKSLVDQHNLSIDEKFKTIVETRKILNVELNSYSKDDQKIPPQKRINVFNKAWIIILASIMFSSKFLYYRFAYLVGKFFRIKIGNYQVGYIKNKEDLYTKLLTVTSKNSWDFEFYKRKKDLYASHISELINNCNEYKKISEAKSRMQLSFVDITIWLRMKTIIKKVLIYFKLKCKLMLNVLKLIVFVQKKSAFYSTKTDLHHEYKDELKSIWKNDRKLLNFLELNDMKFSFFSKIKNVNKSIKSEIEYTRKLIPTEVYPFKKYLMGITNLLFGGIGYILGRQYFKGIVFMGITAFLYIALLPFAFGINALGGDGIFGLAGLGRGHYQSDSRFFVVEGVYAYMLLAVTFTYVITLGISGYRLGKIEERGIRLNGWIVSTKQLDKKFLPYVLSIPAIVVVIFTTITPLMALFVFAFTNWGANAIPQLGDTLSYVGFDNFKTLFGEGGFGGTLSKEFGRILLWTLIWGLSTWLLGMILNIFIAILVTSDRIKLQFIWKTIMILPMAIPGFIMILMFKLLLKSPTSVGAGDEGPLFKLLVSMNLWSETISSSSSGVHVNEILKNAAFVKTFLILLSLWFGIGGGMLFYTGLMTGIPKNLYEAAKIDGASAWKQQATITIPHLLFIIGPTLLPALIGSLNNYGLIWLFNDGGPDYTPLSATGAGQTDIILSWVYKLVRKPTQFPNSIGITAVISIFFGLVSVTISLPGVLRSRMFREGEW